MEDTVEPFLSPKVRKAVLILSMVIRRPIGLASCVMSVLPKSLFIVCLCRSAVNGPSLFSLILQVACLHRTEQADTSGPFGNHWRYAFCSCYDNWSPCFPFPFFSFKGHSRKLCLLYPGSMATYTQPSNRRAAISFASKKRQNSAMFPRWA